MKKILFALIFLPCLALGQFPKFDTLYFKTDTIFSDTLKVPNYREHLEQVFDDGRTKVEEREIGDSETTLKYYINQAIELNRQFAYHASLTSKKREVMHAMNLYAGALEDIGLPDLWNKIQELFENNFVGKAKIYDKVNDPLEGQLIKMSSGVLRLKFGDFNSRVLILSDRMIRVFSYPTDGNFVDLYMTNPGVFSSIEKDFIIKFKR